ncbi:nuclear transport factor 2 family protein [Persicitalea jodogahamensis]|nr:nuclear transport factor 2 family protein [Persicitalea jodogahamensis]
MPVLLCLLLFLLAACRSNPSGEPASSTDYSPAPTPYLVLAQKAITYQADYQLDAWGSLLAEDVEYHIPGISRLRGRTAVLAHWRQNRDSSHIRQVRLSEFSILPMQTLTKLPLADLPGVYVAAAFRQRVVYASGQTDEQPVSLWLHFNEEKLIDRLYGFQNDRLLHNPDQLRRAPGTDTL